MKEPESLGGLRHGQTGEESQFHQRGRVGISFGEELERLVEGQQIQVRSLNLGLYICQVDPLAWPAGLETPLAPGRAVRQDIWDFSREFSPPTVHESRA